MEESYGMKCTEFFPLVGTIKFPNRIEKINQEIGRPKFGTEEHKEYEKGIKDSLKYHFVVDSFFLLATGFGLYKCLEKLL